jgi:hypothetical protein
VERVQVHELILVLLLAQCSLLVTRHGS